MGTFKKVSLLGANGNLGPSILHSLVHAGFETTVLKRATSKSSTEDYPAGVRIAEIPDDFKAVDLIEILRGQDAVIACIKGSLTEVQQQLAEASALAGVTRFIPADFGSCDSQSQLTQDLVPLYRRKTEVRAFLQRLVEKYPNFSWTSLVPGHFFDWSLHFIHIYLSERRADVLDDGNLKFSITTLSRIGEATARILQRPEQTRNQILYVHSFRVTQRDVISAYERATNTQWQITEIPSKKFQEEQSVMAAQGSLEAVEELVWYLGTIDADWTTRKGFAMDLLDLQDEDLDSVVKRIVARTEAE